LRVPFRSPGAAASGATRRFSGLRLSSRAVAQPAPRTALTFGLAAALCLTPAAAFAHAFLVRAVPAVGATVRTAPSQLTIFYTEAVVPHFCQVTVRGPGGVAVAVGHPHTQPKHPSVLEVPLPRLAPGHYTVTWHAVSTDTHHTQGRFGFTVAGKGS
jgi:copper resistance protein C